MDGAKPLDLIPAGDLLEDIDFSLEAAIVEVPPLAVVPSEPLEGAGVDLKSPALVKNAAEMMHLDDYPALTTEQRVFLIAYAAHGTVSRASLMSGVPQGRHRKWLKEDESYQEVFEMAENVLTDRILEVSLREALKADNIKERMFHLQARRPEKFAPKAALAVKGEVKHTHSIADLARQAYAEGVLDDDE